MLGMSGLSGTGALRAHILNHYSLHTELSQRGSLTSSTNDEGKSIGGQAVTQYQGQAEPSALKNSQARQSPGQKSDLPGEVCRACLSPPQG